MSYRALEGSIGWMYRMGLEEGSTRVNMCLEGSRGA